MTQAGAGWYPDPQTDAHPRYWDGSTWTDHTAPATVAAPAASSVPGASSVPAAPAQPGGRRLHPLALVGIIVGIVVGLLILVSIIAAVAVPVVLQQQDQADTVASGLDTRDLGAAITTAMAEADGGEVDVLFDGVDYVIFVDEVEHTRLTASPGSTLVEFLPAAGGFCVSTLPQGATVPVFLDTVTGEAGDGYCT